MATSGKQNGTITYLTLGGTQMEHQVELSFDVTQDAIDASTKDTGRWRSYLNGNLDATGSCTAYYDEDATSGFAEILATLTGNTQPTIRITTGVTGDTYYEFVVTVSNVSQNAPDGEVRSYSFSWQNTGTPTLSGTET